MSVNWNWKENCVGFNVENGFIVVYKGGKELFKVKNSKNNMSNLVKLLNGG